TLAIQAHNQLQGLVQTLSSILASGGSTPPPQLPLFIPPTAADIAWIAQELPYLQHAAFVLASLPQAANDVAQNWTPPSGDTATILTLKDATYGLTTPTLASLIPLLKNTQTGMQVLADLNQSLANQASVLRAQVVANTHPATTTPAPSSTGT